MHWAKVLIESSLACLLFILIPRPRRPYFGRESYPVRRPEFSEIDLYRTESISTDRSVVMRIIWDRARHREILSLRGEA